MNVRVRVENPPEEAILLWRRYEDDVLAAIRSHLGEGMVALDVGSNCGVLSLFMRRAVGDTGRVISVDPSRAACRRTAQQAEINGFDNVEVVQMALTENPGALSYREGKVGIGVLPSLDAAHVTSRTVAVSEMTLDALVESLGLHRLDFVKVDTDGSELSILRSGEDTLQRHRPVVSVEINPEGLRARGQSTAALLAHLRERGYRLFDPEFRRQSPLSRAPQVFATFVPFSHRLEQAAVHNVLALPAERAG
jgi:FkbM family methyltransferase